VKLSLKSAAWLPRRIGHRLQGWTHRAGFRITNPNAKQTAVRKSFEAKACAPLRSAPLSAKAFWRVGQFLPMLVLEAAWPPWCDLLLLAAGSAFLSRYAPGSIPAEFSAAFATAVAGGVSPN